MSIPVYWATMFCRERFCFNMNCTAATAFVGQSAECADRDLSNRDDSGFWGAKLDYSPVLVTMAATEICAEG